ncbi:hypothetical protein R3W88_019480 [Solanum pinnatisectum]|uniref:indole-3-pyruvate monooxygenase n=1 Tax=Solanum pinnatisectum TaxID=50273 RepID=A0AAV9KJC7_9SOLN|nr:hypothetical protein R3W88_019480 [Solanum pinnatisectum]
MVNFSKEEVEVVVVGASPLGTTVSSCLTKLGIKIVVLEKEDCSAYLWKKKTYDRLHLHLSKDFCSLPFMPHATSSPKYLPKIEFIQYLDEYKKWNVKSRNVTSGEMELYACDFLILATRENNEGYIPKVVGTENFKGEIIHSSDYKSSEKYKDNKVLVIGSGISGMEISFDLSNYGSHTSIAVRSPIHVVTREMVHVGMVLLKYLPISLADTVIAKFAKFKFGNLVELGIPQLEEGPFSFKISKGTSPVIDVEWEEHQFDAIIFATRYKNVATKWLKDYSSIFLDDGRLKNAFPNHWKGENGLYCVGFSKRGLASNSMDAITIVDAIKTIKGNKI